MKKILITGSNRGIGLETALAFGRDGYKVFATMRNPEKAKDLKEIIAKENLDIVIYKMDVDDDASVSECFEAILKDHTIDILVNNAGIERHGSVEEIPMEDYKAIMETNYFGVIRCVKAVLPQMRKNRQGCIINVASIAGHISNTPLGAYAASKFALEAISEALAGEVKPFNIKVTIVEPGIINTQMALDIKISISTSIYPQVRRFGGLYDASLNTPTPPTLVADKILEIAKSDSWQLRYPVGPDALPFIQWRAALTDEEWVNFSAQNDEDWYNALEANFGLNAR